MGRPSFGNGLFRWPTFEVPKSAAAAFDDVLTLDAVIDTESLTELIALQCPLSCPSAAFDRLVHLHHQPERAENHAAYEKVMEHLVLFNLISLDLSYSQVPAIAWQKLRGNQWPNLKTVNLSKQLGAEQF